MKNQPPPRKHQTIVIENYISVTRILEILNENHADVSSAELHATAFKEYNSYGDEYAATELELSFYVKEEK